MGRGVAVRFATLLLLSFVHDATSARIKTMSSPSAIARAKAKVAAKQEQAQVADSRSEELVTSRYNEYLVSSSTAEVDNSHSEKLVSSSAAKVDRPDSEKLVSSSVAQVGDSHSEKLTMSSAASSALMSWATLDGEIHFSNSVSVPRRTALIGTVVVVSVFGIVCCLATCLMKPKGSVKGKDKLKQNDALLNVTQSPSTEVRKTVMHDGRKVYEWSQTASVVTVFIQVPAAITKNDLDIKLNSRLVQVGCKDKPPFLVEEPHGSVNEELSGWRLRTNSELQLHLSKTVEGEWPCVFVAMNSETEEEY